MIKYIQLPITLTQHICKQWRENNGVYGVFHGHPDALRCLPGHIVEECDVPIVQRSLVLAERAKQYPTDGLLIDHIVVADICESGGTETLILVIDCLVDDGYKFDFMCIKIFVFNIKL